MSDAEKAAETPGGERELSRLLRLGAPHLTVPAGWTEQIRRRAARRRRRRAALLTAVAAVAAGVALAGGLLGTPGTDGTAPPADPPQIASVQRSAGRVTNDLSLSLWTPAGWHTLNTSDFTSYVTVFVANRPLGAAGRCTEPTSGGFTCAPVSRLADGQILISFRQEDDPPEARWSNDRLFTVRALDRPGKGCRSLGGDEELKGWGRPAHLETNRLAVNAYVCLRGASAATRQEAGKLLGSAVAERIPAVPKFGPGSGAGPAGRGAASGAP